MATTKKAKDGIVVTELTGDEDTKAKKPHVSDRRRGLERTAVFGDLASTRIWYKVEKGFCTIPRTLPLLCTLIRELTTGADAARVYLDFWGRQHDDGFVEIVDEGDMASACGYQGAHRGVRYWRTGVKELERLGFIEVKPRGARTYGYVLLLHHDDVVKKLLMGKPNRVPAWWTELYDRRLRETGVARKRRVPPVIDL